MVSRQEQRTRRTARLFTLFLASLFFSLFTAIILFPAAAPCAGEDEAFLGIGGEWSFDEDGAPLYISRNWSFDDIAANISGSEISGRSESISFYGTIKGNNLVLDISLNAGTQGDSYVYWDAKGVVVPIPEDGGRTYSDEVPISISYADNETGEGGLYSGTLRLEASLEGELFPTDEDEDDSAAGTTDAEEDEADTTPAAPDESAPAPEEGTKETWWGSVVSLLVSMTVLVSAAGPFLFSLLSRGISALPPLPAQAQAGTFPPQALQPEQPYQPFTDGAVLTYGASGHGEETFQALHDKLTGIKRGIPAERAQSLDRIWDDYVRGDIGKDKLELVVDLLKNEELPLQRVDESYDLFLRWERSRADKAGSTIRSAVISLAKSKLDPFEFAKGEIADEAGRLGALFKDTGLLKLAKLYGRYSQYGEISDCVNLAIESCKAAGYLMEESDYPHFDQYLEQMRIPDVEVPDRLASTRRQIEDYAQKLAEQKQLYKETAAQLTEGDTAEGARSNQAIRDKLERVDGMADAYQDVLDDLSVEERVYMMRNKGEAPVIKPVKPGDKFVRPDIDGIETY